MTCPFQNFNGGLLPTELCTASQYKCLQNLTPIYFSRLISKSFLHPWRFCFCSERSAVFPWHAMLHHASVPLCLSFPLLRKCISVFSLVNFKFPYWDSAQPRDFYVAFSGCLCPRLLSCVRPSSHPWLQWHVRLLDEPWASWGQGE